MSQEFKVHLSGLKTDRNAQEKNMMIKRLLGEVSTKPSQAFQKPKASL